MLWIMENTCTCRLNFNCFFALNLLFNFHMSLFLCNRQMESQFIVSRNWAWKIQKAVLVHFPVIFFTDHHGTLTFHLIWLYKDALLYQQILSVVWVIDVPWLDLFCNLLNSFKMKLITRNGLLLAFAAMLILCEFNEFHSDEEGTVGRISVEAIFLLKKKLFLAGALGMLPNKTAKI